MNQEKKDKTHLIFKEVQKTLKQLGVEKFIETLKKSRQYKKTNLSDENRVKALQIIHIVCDEFSLSYDGLISRESNRNIKCLVLGICTILLTNKLNLYGKDLSELLKRSDAFLSAQKNKVLNLKSTNIEQQEIILKIKSIETKIKSL